MRSRGVCPLGSARGTDRLAGQRGAATAGDDYALLAALPVLAHRIGGSHAHRGVLSLTLLRAVQQIRRPQPVLAAVA